METSDCMRASLLLVFISAAHLSPDPVHIFGIKGGYAELGDFEGNDDYVLYRVYEDGDLLLVNCSQPDSPQPDGYSITCLEGDVDMSREYRAVYVRDGRAVLCEFDSALGNGSSLQLYRYGIYTASNYTLVLDTSSSLEPIVPFWRDRLQVDTNTSRVTLTGIMYSERMKKFLCTMWKGGHCQQARSRMLEYVVQFIVTHEKENVALPCTVRRDFPEQVYWETPTGEVRISSSQTRPQEVMYMLNGSQSGDYSLIIPFVSQQHNGTYICCGHLRIHKIFLSVCVEFSPVTVMFSHGENVLMDAHVNDSETLHRVRWFRQKGLHPQMLIIEFVHKYSARRYGMHDEHMPEDLMGRVTVFNSGMSLNISNLTAEDSGVYTWRVKMGESWQPVCYEGSIRLVYKDPFGVHTPFYRAYSPLLACVLLGLVAAVIWLKLRSRGGVLTPGGQEMEMQDIGDDVSDDVEEVGDVEEAEDSI